MARGLEKKGLGRGLSALLADTQTTGESEKRSKATETSLPIEKVLPNPDQPRRDFPEDDLAELAKSVSEKGIIQPLIVRPSPTGDGTFQIVAGERRWRAAQRAKLHEVPVVVRTFSDVEVLEIAIIENIQRADLNPIEEALGYRQLMDKFGHTQEKLAEALGKSRSHIANLLRLLGLPDEVLKMVREGKLSAGHARTLVVSADPIAHARQIVAEGLSVRKAEQLAKQSVNPVAPKAPRAMTKDADTRAIEQDLSANLGLKVSIDYGQDSQAGKVTISYKNLDELDGICQKLST